MQEEAREILRPHALVKSSIVVYKRGLAAGRGGGGEGASPGYFARRAGESAGRDHGRRIIIIGGVRSPSHLHGFLPGRVRGRRYCVSDD